MNEIRLLDELVPRFEEPGDWNDVLRRARRLPRRRFVLVAAVLVAALVVGPALGVLLTRDKGPQLPAGADLNNVVVILQPVTGRLVVKAAPWKDHSGVCYAVFFLGRSGRGSGCVDRSTAGSALVSPLVGYTFDKRVVSGRAMLVSGKHVPIVLRHLPRLGVTFFFARGRLPGLLFRVSLLDANGHVVRSLLNHA